VEADLDMLAADIKANQPHRADHDDRRPMPL
jgi:hypothetical protein